MKNILAISVLSLILITNSCKKNTPVHSVDAGLKTAFNFQPGTYWIYKDSISSQVDSFAVTSNQPGTAQTNGYIDNYIDIFVSEFPVNATSNTIQWEYGLNGNDFILIYENQNALSNIGKSSINYGHVFSYPFIVGYTHLTNDILNTIIVNSTSFLINSRNYSDVAIVNSTVNYYPENWSFNNWFYVVENIGFIKIVLNQPNDSLYRIWELQRYNIVK